MNAQTGLDSTEYFYSLPSNRIELWFLLESQRFLHPVFREFYKERDVVMEEYRMRVESSPQGKLLQAFLATAFEAHPYRIMGTGWPSDIQNLRVADAWNFFRTYYVPVNIMMANRGRRESGGSPAHGREVFRPAAQTARCRRWCRPSSRRSPGPSRPKSNRPASRSR